MESAKHPDTVKHLELIQGVINRTGSNSFLLKGWTITLVAGLFALAASNQSWIFALAALVPSVAFWALDAYYLRQERLFRKLYDAVRAEELKPDKAFSMDSSAYVSFVDGLVCTMFSKSIGILHGIVVATVVVASVVLHCYPKG